MKKVIIALLLVLNACSLSSCAERYTYIDKEVDNGNEWYLDTQSIRCNRITGTLTYRVDIGISSKYHNYLINQSRVYDYQTQNAAREASHIMLYQTVNFFTNEFMNTRAIMYNREGRLLKNERLTHIWNEITPKNMVGEVIAWISKNQPSAIFPFGTGYSVITLITFFFACGMLVSVMIWLFIEFISYVCKQFDDSPLPKQVSSKAEVIDAEFSDNQQDDFDYPYEDISKVIGEKQ